MLIIVCAWCNRYQDALAQWQPLNTVENPALLTHGICPACEQQEQRTKLMKRQIDKATRREHGNR